MRGKLEVITGPMFSGKTEELLRRLRREKIAGRKVILFKPSIDNRYGDTHTETHNGVKMEAQPARSSDDVDADGFAFDVIGIDEVQFLDDRIIQVIHSLVNAGKKVIVSGLDMTFRRDPFNFMGYLMAVAEDVEKLSAICHSCGEEAFFTQRLHDGEPASFSEATVEVGGTESYEARCRNCFESRQ